MSTNKMREALEYCVQLLEFLEPEVRGGYSPDGALAQAREALAADDAARGTMPPALSEAEVKHIVRTTPGPQGFQAALVRAGWDAAMTAVEASRAAAPQSVEPVAWREHVEQRLMTWRQSFVSKSGDQLALDDFMDKESLDDLIDFVCDEYAHLSTRPAQAEPTREFMQAIQLAYGYLWHINNEPAAPMPMYEAEKAAYQARKHLRDLLTTEQRGEGINQVGVLIGRYDAAMSAPPTKTKEPGHG